METDAGPREDARRGWLCRTEMERARFVDMNERVRTARRVQGASMGLAVALGGPVFTWWLVAFVAVALATLGALEKVPSGSRAHERASAFSMLTIMVLLGLGVLFSGGAASPYLPFLAVPTLMLAARFRLAVVLVGLAASGVVTGAAVLGALALPAVAQAPGWLYVTAFLALMAGLAGISLTLLSAEMQSRGDAVVDPLTGLFNRKALLGRFHEAAAQAQVLGGPVALVLCDLDHFKQVNDQFGHDRGDVVLRETAYRLRKTLRTFDLVYRIGGEEFLVLLPGQDLQAATQVAERLVADVAAEPLGGLPVTMSAGAASDRASGIDLDRLLKRADVALYAAKRSGRNRACSELDPALR